MDKRNLKKISGNKKLFVVRKYILASNALEAIKKEKFVKPDDVFVDDEWKRGQVNQLTESIGFKSK